MKTLRFLSVVLAVAAMLGLSSLVLAKDKAPADPNAPKPLMGKVVKVDGTNLVISVGKKTEAKDVTIKTDDKTVVTIEGAAGKLADLTPGQHVKVTGSDGSDTAGPATKIEVMAPKSKKPADGAPGAAPTKPAN